MGGTGQSLAGSAGALLAVHITADNRTAGLPQAMLVLGSAGAALVLSARTAAHGRSVALANGYLAATLGCGVVLLAAVFGRLALLALGSALLGAGNTSVMLSRYAAAEGAEPAHQARAMGSVLLATTVGAVLGPNLLAPASATASRVGLPELAGPYLVAALAFVAAAWALRPRRGAARPAPPRRVPHPSTPVRLARSAALGLTVLAVANLVMVGVMTVTPVHLQQMGMSLGGVGLMVSAHIAAMFAPSPVSGWLTDRTGGARAAGIAAGITVLATVLVGTAADNPLELSAGLVVLGLGWNLSLVAGSTLLTAGTPEADRPRREGWGELSMGVAAAGGGLAAGGVMAADGYAHLALAAAASATLVLPALAVRPPRRPSAATPVSRPIARQENQ